MHKRLDPEITGEAHGNVTPELDSLVEQIWHDLSGQVPRLRVSQVASEVATEFHDATIITYVPFFIRRLTRERLAAQDTGD